MDYKNNKAKIENLRKKIWKSEMERQDLEFKFEKLMRERANCEKSAIKSIKTRYEKFIDDDSRRTTRNGNLLKLLERIDYQASTLAAKTERLRLLKAQHELYLMKNWNSNRLAKSTQWTQPYQFPSSLGISKASQNYCLYDQQPPPPTLSPSMPPLITSNNNEGENNLKSDFVKYLSQINRFDDGAGTTYDNNNILGISPTANEINFSSNVEMFPSFGENRDMDSKFVRIANSPASILTTPTNNNNAGNFYKRDFDKIESLGRIFDDQQQRQQRQQQMEIPELRIHAMGDDDAGKTPSSILVSPYEREHHWQNPKTIKGMSESRSAYKQDPMLVLPYGETDEQNIKLVPKQQHFASGGVGINGGTSGGNLLPNNSSGMRAEINNAAVSISNTSDHTGAININGDIKAIHQNKHENNISVKYQITGDDDDDDCKTAGASTIRTKENDGTNVSGKGPSYRTTLNTSDNSQLIAIDYGNQTISQAISDPSPQHRIEYKNTEINDMEHTNMRPSVPTERGVAGNGLGDGVGGGLHPSTIDTSGVGKHEKPISSRIIKTHNIAASGDEDNDGNAKVAAAAITNNEQQPKEVREIASPSSANYIEKIDYPASALNEQRQEFNNRNDVNVTQDGRRNENTRNHNFNDDTTKYQQPSIDNIECSNINKNESVGGLTPGSIPNRLRANDDTTTAVNCNSQKNENKIFDDDVVEKHEIENEKENILIRKDGAAVENANVVQVNPGDKDGYEFSNHDFTESIGKSVNQEDDVQKMEEEEEEEGGKQFGESILAETTTNGDTVVRENQSADDTAYYQTPDTANEQFEQYPADQTYDAAAYDQTGDQQAQQYDPQYDQQYENYGNYEGGEYTYAEGDQQGNYDGQQYVGPEDQQAYDETYTQPFGNEGGENPPNAGETEGVYDDQQNYYQDPNAYNQDGQIAYDPQAYGDPAATGEYQEQPANYEDYQYPEQYPVAEDGNPQNTDQYPDGTYYNQEPGENYYNEEYANPDGNYAPESDPNHSELVENPQAPETNSEEPLTVENTVDNLQIIAPEVDNLSSDQTSYSENPQPIDVDQQQLNVPAAPSEQPPNFLESETDDSTSQQLAQSANNNSESDFDFTAK